MYFGLAFFGWGFRMSTQGQGDGGVYFSALSPASYHMGSATYEDNLITDCFGRGRLAECKYSHFFFIFFALKKFAHVPYTGHVVHTIR